MHDERPIGERAADDPELMKLWGEINNAWDDIEHLLYRTFDAMLSEETSFATQAVFYSQTSHAARRTMVESLAKYALVNRPQTAHKLANAIARVKARSGERNLLAHGQWAISADLPTGKQDFARISLGANMIPDPQSHFNRERLKQVRAKMRDTTSALREAIAPIEEAKRAKALTLGERHMARATLLEEPLPSSHDKSRKEPDRS